MSSQSVLVATCDPRCVMLNLDPERAAPDARIMNAVVRLTNNAGVYATVVRTGAIRVGERISLA